MIRLLLLLVVAVAIGMALAPRLLSALSWVLAFLILLMLGDLLLAALRTRRRRR